MKDSNYLQKVADFMTQFNQAIPQYSTIPSKEICDLRVKLIQEELDELQKAFNDKNEVEILDALMDLQYVLTGAILACGMQGVVNEAFTRVHRSNMSKACSTKNEADISVEKYTEEGVEVGQEYNQQTGLINLYRKSDKKVMKNKFYQAVVLDDLVIF